jgi:hypothetical protein
MAQRPSLGSRPVNLRAEPEPPEEPEEEEGDPEAEAALDLALQNLKSLRGRDVDPRELLAALDDVERLGGGQGDWSAIKEKQENLRANIDAAGKSKAQIARQGLNEHLDWIDSTNLTDVERAQATLHAFSSRVDDLDPVEDADTIAAAQKMFAAVNPPTQD